MSNSDKLEHVELIPAFSWTCESCGQENFARTVVAQFSEEEMEELRREYNVQPWETGDFLQKPDTVECSHCKTVFATLDYNSESSDE